MPVTYQRRGRVAVVTVDRPERRNAIDHATAEALSRAWKHFDADPGVDVGVLYGAGGVFSAGADLRAFDLTDRDEGFLGFTRLNVGKPTIAAIEGFCVAGGLEMALWCDVRVAAETATFGCFERRFGVPLVDGGTQRLPRVVGLGRALEMILTGRAVNAEEAQAMGLANLVVPEGQSLDQAVALAARIAEYPQETVRSDRLAVLDGLGERLVDGLEIERLHGLGVLGTARDGAARFARGAGRSGKHVVTVSGGQRENAPVAAEPADRPGERGHIIAFPIPNGEGRGYLAVPDAGRGSAVLVLPDRAPMGRHLADTMAHHGFVALTPELSEGWRGEGGLDGNDRLLASSVDHLIGLPSVVSRNVGVVGFGAGAQLGLWLSTVKPEVAACVLYGATAPRPRTPLRFQNSRSGYLGHTANDDPDATPEDAYRLEMALRGFGLDATWYVYPGTGPGFWDPSGASHHPGSAEQAWDRTVAFLRRSIHTTSVSGAS